MGLERLTSILQGVDSNYDTDIFQPIFKAIHRITKCERPYQGKVGAEEDIGLVDMAYRVVADHIRTLSFAIADGAVPSNDGRGYVLRRILRRAVRYGRQNLQADLGFFAQLVPTLVQVMGNTYPELVEKQDHITRVIREEEESFSRTLDKGLQKFNEFAASLEPGQVFSGADAHFLYTSMGFPVDLTQLMAEEKGISLDVAGFDEKMKQEQELSAAAHLAKLSGAEGDGKDMRMVAEQTSYLVNKGVTVTDDSAKYVWHQDLAGCKTMALFIGRNETEDKIGFVESVTSENGTVGVILDKTSFYAEAGGQINDTGVLKSSSGAVVKVTNVQLYGQFVLHMGKVTEGTLNVGDAVTASVDYVRRAPIASNHTMTHVLNFALKDVLVTQPQQQGKAISTGTVDQKGSLVDEAKLRFDFSWNGPLTTEQLAAVEAICVDHIEREVPVEAYVAPLADAEKISSLRAVFGEKYPDPVRVVTVSNYSVPTMLANPQDATWNGYSVEFCGGTHLTNTKEAQAFCLLSEEGIAKGIRRIVGVTMDDAKLAIQKANEFEQKLVAASAMKGDELEAQVKLLTTEVNGLSISAVKKAAFRDTIAEFGKRVVAYKKEKAAGMTNEIVEKVFEATASTSGNKLVVRYDFGIDGKVAKLVTAAFGKKIKDKALMLISSEPESDRFLLVTFAPKGFEDVDCQAWATVATEGTEGKGGGKKDGAQFTIPGVANIDSVMAKAQEFSG
jgi:alanyl-tRNA synthetase